MTTTLLPFPVSSRAHALLSGARVCLLHAPPGMGAAGIVETWADSRPGAVRLHDCGEGEASAMAAHVASLNVTDPNGTLIITGGHHLTDPDLRSLEAPAGWRIAVIDEVSAARGSMDGVTLVRGCDLVVSDAEARDYFGASVAAATVTQWAQATHGWPGLLQVAFAAHHRHQATEAAELSIADAVRFDVLPWLTSAWPALAPYLIVAGTVSAAEIAAVAPDEDPFWAVALTNHANLQPVRDHDQDALRLMPAARTAGLDDLRTHRPDEFRRVLELIATTRADVGALDCGLEAAHDLRDWDLCVRIMERWWLHLLFHSDVQLLTRVVAAVPDTARRSSLTAGHLAELIGVVPLGSVPVPCPTRPDEIEALVQGSEVRAFVERMLLAIIARRLRGQNKAARSLALAAAVVVGRATFGSAREDHGPIPGCSVGDLKTFFYLQCGLTAQLADDPEMTVRMLNHAWLERAWDSTGFAARGTAVRLGLEAAVAGEPAAALRWLARAEHEPHTSVLAETWASRGVDLTRYIVALDSADPEEMARARTALAEGAEREEQWPFISWALTRHALMHGDPERALKMLDAMCTQYPRQSSSDGLHATLLPTLRAEIELALGHGTAALAGARPTTYFGRVTEARIWLLAGHHDEARSIAAETAASPGLTRRARIEALLVQSVAELRLGLLPAATANARRVAGLMSDDGPPTALLAVPHGALKELATAIPAAAPLVTLREQLPTSDIYPESVDLVHLTERESAVLHHLADGLAREELARVLFVSENTVKTQVRTLYAKLGASTRADALVRARELGFLAG